MGEQDPKDKTSECIFTNVDILNNLYENKVPEDLQKRLTYTADSLNDGTTLEVYSDTETGDQYRFGTLPTIPFVTVYRIIRTTVGEYKILSYHGPSGYAGSEFFFNEEETNSRDFWDILKKQTVLAS
ncbi:MAG: hypothetical protein UR73_C0024G0005 [candidate division WS6 bacterium GW2011_GWF1_35_23]|uniref:Uncharacterized protein n=1 Tax=candidate division WS6 bacterium GW2011_GWF1_35_23 TaxID=1619097 RepID=A0A0G0C6A7_9BACT|nr:MAG: hypothetical protein UR73_C0024G0005 [candidate division WS6 bacterium GW2011_GWF1_35_23]